MKTSRTKNIYKKGFGLLEVLISAVIVIIILAALVTIGRAALNNNESLAERAQAIYLAQDGIEKVRQIRDTNWIDGSSTTKWNTLDGTTPITTSKNYTVTFSSNKLVLLEDPTLIGENIPLSGVTFNRKINVVPTTSTSLLPNGSSTDLTPYAMKVTSTVTWKFSGKDKTINLSEILTNWRPDF